MGKFKSFIFAAAVAALSFSYQGLAQAGSVLAGGEVIQTASFVGQSDHTVSGQVQLVRRGDVLYLVLGDDFQFDGAPDPRIGFFD